MYKDDRSHRAYQKFLEDTDFALQQKLTEQKFAVADWVQTLKPWECIAHMTWRDWDKGEGRGTSLDSAQRCFEKFMRKELPGVSYFYALESNTGMREGLGYHVHALLADAMGVERRSVWAKWYEKFGRNRIEPIKSQGDVVNYCAKYVTKEGAWWNVKVHSDCLRKSSATTKPTS